MTWEEQAVDNAEAAVWTNAGTWEEGVEHCLSMIEPHVRFDRGPVAEIGCGIGRLLHPLALRHPDCRFVGQDPTSTMIAKARAACPDPARVTYDGTYCLRLPADPFGAVYSVVTFQHLRPAFQFAHLADASVYLADGGRLRIQWTPVGDTGPLCHPVDEERMLRWIDLVGLDLVDVEDDPMFPTWRWLTAERLPRD